MQDVLGFVDLSTSRNPFNYVKIEQINRDVVTPWLTLDEIVNQLNLFGDESQDAYLSMLEVAVRMHIEDYLGAPFTNQSYRVYYALKTVYGSSVSLDLPEVSQGGVTINSVKYTDVNNAVITLAKTDYYYDQSGSKIVINTIPNDMNYEMTSPVVAEYTIKPSPLSTYPTVKQAGLLLFTHLYNNRSETTNGGLQKIPFGVDTLLRPYKPLVM